MVESQKPETGLLVAAEYSSRKFSKRRFGEMTAASLEFTQP